MRHKYFIVVFAMTIFFLVSNLYFYQYYYNFDYWAYSASIKELANHLLSPSNPHIYSDQPAHWYSPYILFWAAFKKFSGLDVFTVLGLAGAINFILLSAGIYRFIRDYFSDYELPFYVLITLLFFWGTGWDFSGCFDFDLLRNTLCYPYIISFALSLFCFSFAKSYFETNKLKYFIYIILCNSFILLTHLITASFCFMGLILTSLMSNKVSLRYKAVIWISIIISVFIAFSWPYYSLFNAVILSQSIGVPYSMVLYDKIIIRLGPLSLGVIPLIYSLFKKEHLLIVIWTLLCIIIYIISYFIPNAVGQRYLFYSSFFLAIFISLTVRGAVFKSHKSFIYVYIAILIACVSYQSAKITYKYLGYRSITEILNHEPSAVGINGYKYLNRYNFLKEYVGEKDVVISDLYTSWILPTFSGKSVSISIHYNPLITNLNKRYLDNKLFFNQDTDMIMRRNILNKYKVEYILVNSEFVSPKMSKILKELGNSVYKDNRFDLITVKH